MATDALDALIRKEFGHLGMESMDDWPVVDGFDCVEYVRKIRTMHYKEENGIPCEEETRYVDDMARRVDEAWEANIKRLKARKKAREKELAVA